MDDVFEENGCVDSYAVYSAVTTLRKYMHDDWMLSVSDVGNNITVTPVRLRDERKPRYNKEARNKAFIADKF